MTVPPGTKLQLTTKPSIIIMNNSNISAENNNNNNNNNNNTEVTAMKKYTIQIADRTGHSTVADLSLEEAVTNILDNVENNARFAYINGEPFAFKGTKARSEENVAQLKTVLQASEDTEVFLTGKLVGGNR